MLSQILIYHIGKLQLNHHGASSLAIPVISFSFISSAILCQCYMITNKSSGMQSGQPVTVARIPNTHLSKMQHLAPFNLYSWNVTSLINANSRYTDSDNTAHFYDPWKRSGNNYASMKASCHCLQLQHLPCIRLLIITYPDIFQIFQEFIHIVKIKMRWFS